MVATGDNRNFRKVDVDKYDEDAFQEDADTSSAAFNESEFNNLINNRNFADAVKYIASSPVVSSNDRNQKLSLVDSFIRLNGSIKQPNIDEIVKGLSFDEMNSLMKVVYMVFGLRPESDQTLIHGWFDKLFQQVGHGSIVRVLTDRRAVMLK